MVLAGFVVALGSVVDDAIIDVENIVRRLRQHRLAGSEKSTARIILEASLEVRPAIWHATLIIVLAVMPVFFMGGLAGAFFEPLALAFILAMSTAFSLAAVASHHYGWKVGAPAYVFASCIGLSRIESNRHNLSDVLAGATIGLVVGRTVARLDGQPAAKKRLVSVGPATDLHGQGIGIGVSASW